MTVQKVFARHEVKYLITKAQRALIEERMEPYMRPDEFGRSSICSLYCDTPDSLLIRRSIESPIYKEKLRLRSYGRAGDEDTIYIEVKKKFDSVVYKRRVGMKQSDAMEALASCSMPGSDQISREIDFFLKRYGSLKPAMTIIGDRQAFYAKDDHEFRVTFDENIRYRADNLTLNAPPDGIALTDSDTILMELKAGGAIPLWMCRLLSEQKIFKTSFSKYGGAYRQIHSKEIQNGKLVQGIV
ncbi:MAG: polyphosphate polymerase domain-containing protein [Clostridia bacterium]|nr:polyphosphate polymerase domain-containing protein [Clostridia bacterium]